MGRWLDGHIYPGVGSGFGVRLGVGVRKTLRNIPCQYARTRTFVFKCVETLLVGAVAASAKVTEAKTYKARDSSVLVQSIYRGVPLSVEAAAAGAKGTVAKTSKARGPPVLD